jgi:hypothetical protein
LTWPSNRDITLALGRQQRPDIRNNRSVHNAQRHRAGKSPNYVQNSPTSRRQSHPLEALAAEFEAAFQAQRPFFYGSGTDEEADAATARVDEIARKIVALPTTDTEMMRLKARIYLWSEATDFKTFAAKNEGDGPSEAVLVSLFRDLGADRAPVDPVFAAIARHSVARDALIEAFPRADTVTAKREGREVTKADEEAVEALNPGEEAAFLDLLVIVPTTLEGRRALLQHLVQRDEDGISEPIGELAEKMLRLPMFAQGEART